MPQIQNFQIPGFERLREVIESMCPVVIKQFRMTERGTGIELDPTQVTHAGKRIATFASQPVVIRQTYG